MSRLEIGAKAPAFALANQAEIEERLTGEMIVLDRPKRAGRNDVQVVVTIVPGDRYCRELYLSRPRGRRADVPNRSDFWSERVLDKRIVDDSPAMRNPHAGFCGLEDRTRLDDLLGFSHLLLPSCKVGEAEGWGSVELSSLSMRAPQISNVKRGSNFGFSQR